MLTGFRRFSLVVVIGSLAGCGAATTKCVGDSCDCSANQTCAFGAQGDGAHVTCEGVSTCTGTTGAGSQVVCDGTSCTLTVGAGSVVACNVGTCNLTCSGACTVACLGTCNLTCLGGTSMMPNGCQ